ncbi:MAG: phosphate transport system regulatory protein PhoU [Acidimicrobiia bacterium]
MVTKLVTNKKDTRPSYHQELDLLREELSEIARRVSGGLARCTEALVEGQLEVYDELIEADSDIDRRSAAIENRVYQILATQQPMASDLRFLVSLLRINHEVERTGDLIVNIAKAGKQVYPHRISERLRGTILAMGKQSKTMFDQAIEAFEGMNVGKASALEQMDDVIDDFQRDLLRDIVKTPDEETEVAIRVALIGRFFERIADHAVNIGERVRYMVTGELPGQRHGSKDAPLGSS